MVFIQAKLKTVPFSWQILYIVKMNAVTYKGITLLLSWRDKKKS
jgi:hypothetical protein